MLQKRLAYPAKIGAKKRLAYPTKIGVKSKRKGAPLPFFFWRVYENLYN